MWITLTPDDFASRLSVGEIAVIASGNAQGDNRADIVAQVSGEVRGYVARRNPLGEAGTIPDELQNAAMALATVRFIGQVPDVGLLTEAREDASKDAIRLLRDVAAGDFAITPPATTAAVQPSLPSPAIGQRCRHFSDRDERGI